MTLYRFPFPETAITTGFGGYPGHKGTDFRAARGTPIPAMVGGTVTAKAYSTIGGNWLRWTTDDGLRAYYGHMQQLSPLQLGQRIEIGETTGQVGSTGLATGPHVHAQLETATGVAFDLRPYILDHLTRPAEVEIPPTLIRIIKKAGTKVKCMLLGNLDTGEIAFLIVGGEGYIFKSVTEYDDFRTVLDSYNSRPTTPDEWKWPALPALDAKRQNVLFVSTARWKTTVAALTTSIA